jgi:hypothetical protein
MTGRADRIPPNAISLGVLARADLCTFNWNTRDGWPMGATVALQWLDGKLWFSMDKAEARVHAIRRDPRVAVVLSAPGQSVTIKGRCEFSDDLEVKRRVYRATAETVARLSEAGPAPAAYARYLEGKGSVVFEVIPEKWIAFDGRDGSVTTSPPAPARSGG